MSKARFALSGERQTPQKERNAIIRALNAYGSVFKFSYVSLKETKLPKLS